MMERGGGAAADVALIVLRDATGSPGAAAAYGIAAESREVKAGLPLNRRLLFMQPVQREQARNAENNSDLGYRARPRAPAAGRSQQKLRLNTFFN